MKVNLKLIFGSLFVVIVVAVCLLASFWQFSRLAERKDLNAKIESRMNLDPFELTGEIVGQSSELNLNDFEYRSIQVRGSFIKEGQVIVAGRSFEGAPGFNVVTPLKLEKGEAIIYVNRGWIPQSLGDLIIDNNAEKDIEPLGGYSQNREVIGMVMKNEPKRIVGSSQLNTETQVSPRIATDTFSVLFNKSEAQKVTNFWIQEDFQKVDGKRVVKSSPQKEIFPKQIPKPELNERNHFSYALQWLSFALVAIITWIVILKKQKRAR
ncbi:MAG TPA: SURF1 family protein [Acidimicrobiia bacterium]|nr:SURF1 family protein [Acidimicrobiia bacterium]